VIVFSPLVQALITRISIPWALRITGLIALAVGALAAGIAQQRVAVVRVQYRVFDAWLLRVPGFVPLLGFQFLQFFAYSAGLFFIPSESVFGETTLWRLSVEGYCAAIHVSASQAAGVLSVQAACNAAGRVLAGLLADRLGAVNVLLVGNAMAGVVCLVVWLFAESLGVMFLWAVLWGFFCGGTTLGADRALLMC
jgi:MFS family permease